MASISDYKLLTIIIPTFNRCEQVKQNLDLTIPQVLEHQDYVRIYISDNASTDGTSEMSREYLEKYPNNIFYFCQPQNITASPNFNHAVHAVNSEYVYILGDDDLLFPNFVQTVLGLIKNNPEIGLFHFNYLLGLNGSINCRLLHTRVDLQQCLKKYEDGKQFILEHLNGPSFISSNLFKRELWVNGVKSIKEDCCGYVWFSILLYGCLDYKCAYYNTPVLLQRFPAKNPYSKNFPLYYIVGLGRLFKYLNACCDGLYDKWIDYSQRNNFRNLLILISRVVYYRKFYKEKQKDVICYLKTPVSRVYFSLCLLPLPKFVMGKVAPFVVRSLKICGFN